MSTRYSLNNTFESNDQSIFSTGDAFVAEDSFSTTIASWSNEGFNIDEFVGSIQITPRIKTIFGTIPAVKVNVNSGIQWEFNTSGNIGFEAGYDN